MSCASSRIRAYVAGRHARVRDRKTRCRVTQRPAKKVSFFVLLKTSLLMDDIVEVRRADGCVRTSPLSRVVSTRMDTLAQRCERSERAVELLLKRVAKLEEGNEALMHMLYDTNAAVARTGQCLIDLQRHAIMSADVQNAYTWAKGALVPCSGALICSDCLTDVYLGEEIRELSPSRKQLLATLSRRRDTLVITQNMESALSLLHIETVSRVEDEARCDYCRRRGNANWDDAFFVRDYDVGRPSKRARP